MGLGDFEARQRAMKEQERRRKSETAKLMRQCKSGVSASDLKLAEIKKEVKKSQQDAATFMHENLSKGSQGMSASLFQGTLYNRYASFR